MKCEKCGLSAQGWDLFDYCAQCSKNLCDACIEKGCCGNIPARSGLEEDSYAEAMDEDPEVPK